MKITFINGEMVINHPSGHVDKYTKNDLLLRKEKDQAQQTGLAAKVDNIDNAILSIDNS